MSQKDFREALIEISKPRITKMVVITTALGFFLANPNSINWPTLVFTLIGTAFTCSGSSALNNYLERDHDSLMKRTCGRPLPTGRLQPAQALGFGLLTVLIGTCLLVATVNLLSGFLALLTAFLYVLVYTPLKRLSWLNTFIGAIPGALPPLGGWAAANGSLGLGGWLLFAIMFIWQMPHFYSIAWMYKDDYAKAGYKMITLGDVNGEKTFSQIIFFSVILLIVSFFPFYLPDIGFVYLIAAGLLGIYILSAGIASYFARTHHSARLLLRASIIYLPSLFTFLVIDAII